MDTVHSYRVHARSTTLRSGEVASASVPGSIEFSAPPEFLGRSRVWTPEDLFVAAVVTCFVSTFSSIADLSKSNFVSLDVNAEGRLEKVDGARAFRRGIACHARRRCLALSLPFADRDDAGKGWVKARAF
jgi:organic hydroperoxide reductase OsmC/OhrA